MTDTKRCSAQSCRALMRWVVMTTGRRNPLNADPDPLRGNVLLIDDDQQALLYGGRIGEGVQLSRTDAIMERDRGTDLYLSHWATCPAADLFKGAGKRRKR